MNAMIENLNSMFFPFGPPKKAISRIALCVLVLPMTVFMAQGASVTVNLGLSTENFPMAGLGPTGAGLGQYIVTMGACSSSGGSTTCSISGNFEGTTAGFTAGTYVLSSTYVGTGPSPFLGIEQAAGSDFFAFSSVPATATMTLSLTTGSGTAVVPMLSGGAFATGNTFGFVYAPTPTCSGTPVASCNVAQVGVTAGSSITGRVTGSATFVLPAQTYYFSQLVFGGGWQTTLTYVNYSPLTVTCQTSFYADSGSPLAMPFSQGTSSIRTDTLQAGQVVHDQTGAPLNSTNQQGWAQANCSGPVQASVLYRYYQSGFPTGEAGVNGETAATTKFVTFAQTQTGVAYGNPSTSQTATITLTAISSAGALLGSKVINLGPLGHGSANVGPLLGLQSFTGFMELTSTIPIISLSLNAEVFPVFSSLPPGDLPFSAVLVSP
jgi:hypothetical protein